MMLLFKINYLSLFSALVSLKVLSPSSDKESNISSKTLSRLDFT